MKHGSPDDIAEIARPVVAALSALDPVAGVLCIGSYARGVADASSDVDLYVVCEPALLPDPIRRQALARIPGVSALQVPHAPASAWDNSWAPQEDRLRVEGLAFELSYQTSSWVAQVVDRIWREGALSLPEMPFRPYTVLGLFAHGTLLYDPHGFMAQLKARLTAYPFILKRRLIEAFLPVMEDGLTELQDYARRGIGPGAFLFHLGRVCDAMESILYAINEHYDPATKHGERELARLKVIPDRFLERFVSAMEGPFDREGRHRVADELDALTREVAGLARQALDAGGPTSGSGKS